MATAESLAHELRSRGWNAIASLLNVEGREISGTWVCEIDDDNQHQPVDVNVYHYGPNGHVWQAGTTTHEARASLPKTPLGVRRIAGAELTAGTAEWRPHKPDSAIRLNRTTRVWCSPAIQRSVRR